MSLLKKAKQSSQDKFGKRVGKKMDKIEIAEVSVEETVLSSAFGFFLKRSL